MTYLETAGDFQHLTGDVIGERRTEEEHRPGAFSRRAAASQRNHLEREFAVCRRNAERDVGRLARNVFTLFFGARESCVDKSKRNGVDLDVELAPLLRQRLRHADDARFAGGVVGLTALPRVPVVELTLTI